MKKLTKEQFIEKANKIHNNAYNYSEVNYKNQDTKIKILCLSHGAFEQRPDHHLAGHNCKKCSINNERFENYENLFIERAVKKWHNFYDYSKVKYVTARKKVIIICPVHGEFKQTPDSHLNCKCLKCSISENANKQRHTTEQFINKAKIIHGDKYDYSLIEYNGNRQKVEILCKEHGVFKQTPYNHLLEKGCPNCFTQSKSEIKISNFLKDNNISFIQQKTFLNCINTITGRQLRFDFYLPDFNICIEYDGKQHFESISIWGGEKALKDNKFKDNIKDEFCKKNGINIIRITYKDNLISKLATFLQNIMF